MDGRAANEGRRPLRMWIDSGDSGTSDDNYWLSYNLRDSLVRPGRAGGAWAVGGDLQHMVGFAQQHNESAWSRRVGPALAFLFPGDEEVSAFEGMSSFAVFDVNLDGRMNVDDIYAFESAPVDVNASGSVTGGDGEAMRAVVRRLERAAMMNGRL